MKKINIFLILLLGLVGFASCEDDNKLTINPGAENGTLSFHLNTPSFGKMTYVLREIDPSKTMEVLTCNQPEYGFSASVLYSVQVSFTEQFVDEEYLTLPSAVRGEKVPVNVKEMNNAILALYSYHKIDFPTPPAPRDIYVRLQAVLSTATPSPIDTVPTVAPLYSNVIKLNILPYPATLMPYYEVKELQPYFMIGSAVGDGSWNSSRDNIGQSTIPLNVVEGSHYDAAGEGLYEYVGHIQAGKGFKLIRGFSFDDQWGNANAEGIDSPVHKDGGSKNFVVPEDGYYRITLNSINNTLSIVKEVAPSPFAYSKISIIGAGDWGADKDLTAVAGTNNHVWSATFTLLSDDGMKEGDKGFKFRHNHDWGVNWGGDHFPVGMTANNNIRYTPGTYIVVFYAYNNDTPANYYFFKK